MNNNHKNNNDKNKKNNTKKKNTNNNNNRVDRVAAGFRDDADTSIPTTTTTNNHVNPKKMYPGHTSTIDTDTDTAIHVNENPEYHSLLASSRAASLRALRSAQRAQAAIAVSAGVLLPIVQYRFSRECSDPKPSVVRYRQGSGS